MPLYMITYSTARDDVRQAVDAYIQETFPNAWRGLASVWVVEMDGKAAEVRNHLSRMVDRGDRILIAALGNFAVWHGFEPDSQDWLLRHL